MNIIKLLPNVIRIYCYEFLSKLKFPNYVPYFPHIIDNKYKLTIINNNHISENNNKIYYKKDNILFKGFKIRSNIYFRLFNKLELNKLKKIINIQRTFKFIYKLDTDDVLFCNIYSIEDNDEIMRILYNSWYLNIKLT